MSASSAPRGQQRAGGILALRADVSALDFTHFAIGDAQELVRVVEGRLDRLYADARFRAEDATGRTVTAIDCADETPPGHRTALEFLFNWLDQHAGAVPVRAVGHQVVDGGSKFAGPVRLDAQSVCYLQGLVPSAPARQRSCIRTIRSIVRRWPRLPQVACFETAFYRHAPVLEDTFGLLPSAGSRGVGRRDYDGLSFESVIDALPAFDPSAAHGKTIVVHIGDGAGACALERGRSIAVATGLGDLAGASGTPCRLEPAALRHLMAALRLGSSQVRALVRQGTDLAGGSGLAGRLDRLVASDEPSARVHIELVLYRIGRALEALAAALSGLDAIVFTAHAGAHAVPVRAGLCRRAASLGVDLDPAANDAGGPRLTRPGSRVTAWVIPADERLLVARRTQALVD